MSIIVVAVILITSFLGTSHQNVLPPQNVAVTSKSASSITLKWDPSVNASSYQAFYKKSGSGSEWRKITGISQPKVTISGLKPYTEYLIQVLAVAKDSLPGNKTAVLTVKTDESEPSAIPTITKFYTTSSTIVFQWNSIPKDKENGPLLGYYAYYMVNNGDISQIQRIDIKGAERRNATITGLRSSTQYLFGVVAYNSKGFNVNLVSTEHLRAANTTEGVPNKPNGLTVRFTSPSALSISWTNITAEQANGVLKAYHYIVYKEGIVKVNKTVNVTTNHVAIDGLDACREYIVKVAGSTAAGIGGYSEFKLGSSCPRITHYKARVVAKIHSLVVLPCNVTSAAMVTITWILNDGAALKINQTQMHLSTTGFLKYKTVHSNGSLVIDIVESSDVGMYQCKAQSIGGFASANVTLVVAAGSFMMTFSLDVYNLTNITNLKNTKSEEYKQFTSLVTKEVRKMFRSSKFYEVDDVGAIVSLIEKDKVTVVFTLSSSFNSTQKKFDVEVDLVQQLITSTRSGRLGSLYVSNLIVQGAPPPPTDLIVVRLRPTYVILRWKTPINAYVYQLDVYSMQYKKHGEQRFRTVNTVQNDGATIYGLLNDLQAGNQYIARVVSHRSTGSDTRGISQEFETPDPMLKAVVLTIVLPLFLAIILVFLFCFVLRKKYKEDTTIINMPLPVQGEENPYDIGVLLQEFPCKWKELNRNDLVLGKELGAGAFGTVVRADLKLNDKEIPCAIKMLKPYSSERDRRDLFNELNIMAQVGYHPNVISLMGACSTDGPLWVVVKLAENGSLIDYLHKHRVPDYIDHSYVNLPGTSTQNPVEIEPISKLRKLQFAHGISKGMSHLELKKCVHRDLATRNVLLGRNLLPMVSDFGLSRDIYECGMYEDLRGGKRPVRWMAPESIEDYTCTIKSDVWSFGVTMWEIETAGTVPYAGLERGIDILNELKKGYRLEQPPVCEDDMYGIMLSCWRANPLDRPSFKDLTSLIEEQLTKISEYLDIQPFQEEYQEAFTDPYDEFIYDPNDVPNGNLESSSLEPQGEAHKNSNDVPNGNVSRNTMESQGKAFTDPYDEFIYDPNDVPNGNLESSSVEPQGEAHERSDVPNGNVSSNSVKPQEKAFTDPYDEFSYDPNDVPNGYLASSSVEPQREQENGIATNEQLNNTLKHKSETQGNGLVNESSEETAM